MDNNNYASQILEENSEQNQKELNSNKSEDLENNNKSKDKIDFSINENPELNQNTSSSSSYLKEDNKIKIVFSLTSRIKPNLIRL